MKNADNLLKLSAALVMVVLAGVCGEAQSVITDNDVYRSGNTAAWMKLSGSSLKPYATLATGGWGIGGGFIGTNAQAVAHIGTSVCIFISDPGSDDIAAFNSKKHLGNYADPTGSGAWTGTAIAVYGTSLYAGYSASVNIGVWTINSDCSLTLSSPAANTPTPDPVNDLAVSPDGRTLIATYGFQNVDSFAISGTTLSEKGPFKAVGYTAGIDITSDSKFVLVGDFSNSRTQVEILPLNSDGTLGASDSYLIAQGGADSNNIWISPDETLLYVSNNVSFQVTTVLFNENASLQHRLIFDCITTLKSAGRTIYATGGLATEATSGNGNFLYVTEAGNPSGIALLEIPPGGCPMEVSGSPFDNATQWWPITVTADPPRPF